MEGGPEGVIEIDQRVHGESRSSRRGPGRGGRNGSRRRNEVEVEVKICGDVMAGSVYNIKNARIGNTAHILICIPSTCAPSIYSQESMCVYSRICYTHAI